MVSVASSFPVASTIAALTPVRMPGSSPIVALGPAGAASAALPDGETSTLCEVGVMTSDEDLFAACSTAEDAPIYVVRETEAS